MGTTIDGPIDPMFDPIFEYLENDRPTYSYEKIDWTIYPHTFYVSFRCPKMFITERYWKLMNIHKMLEEQFPKKNRWSIPRYRIDLRYQCIRFRKSSDATLMKLKYMV